MTCMRQRTEAKGKPSCKQECIPVGFVPSATVAVSSAGGCLVPGGSGPGGSSPGRGCLVRGGICPGGSAPGGIPACTEADIPPVNRMTDRSKHSLRNFVADGNNRKSFQSKAKRPIDTPLTLVSCETTHLHE